MTQYVVEKSDVSVRIDKFLSLKFKDVSRSFVSKSALEFVFVNGKSVKAAYKLKEGDVVEVDAVSLYKKHEQGLSVECWEGKILPQSFDLDIVFEDADCLVLNKPAGVVVHPGVGHSDNTLANYVKKYLLDKGEYDVAVRRAGIVHRLDMPVSGLIVFAKNREFQKYLSEQFENHSVLKIYFADYEVMGDKKVFNEFKSRKLVNEIVRKYTEGLGFDLTEWIEVSGTMKRDPSNRKRMMLLSGIHRKDSKIAKSYILPLSESKMCVLIKTGRMHQIRATLRSLGIVLRGDRLYGWKKEVDGSIGLKSVVLGFSDSSKKRKVFNILDVCNG